MSFLVSKSQPGRRSQVQCRGYVHEFGERVGVHLLYHPGHGVPSPNLSSAEFATDLEIKIRATPAHSPAGRPLLPRRRGSWGAPRNGQGVATRRLPNEAV